MKAVQFVSTSEINREQWLDYRKKGIGGSDAAAILGLNSYVSPFQVYAEKLGLVSSDQDNEAMRQGRDLEEYVASRFTEATGLKVRRKNAILQHPKYPWMLANVDRLIVGNNAGLECKTTSMLNKHKFNQGEFSANYYVQCMHYMAVTGADEWHLAVLVLGKEFHAFTIKRNDREIEALIAAEKHFWEEHVQKEIPPDPDGSESAGEIIKDMYPKASGEVAALFGIEDKIKKYIELQGQIKGLEQQVNALKQEIQLEMKDAEIGNAVGYSVLWKNQNRSSIDSKKLQKEKPEIYESYLNTSSFRKFEIKEIEG